MTYKPVTPQVQQLDRLISCLSFRELQLVVREMKQAGYYDPKTSLKQPKNYLRNLLKIKLYANPENSHGTFEAWLIHILKTYLALEVKP